MGTKLRSWRLEQGLTQQQAAEMMSDRMGRPVRQAQWSRWERGLQPRASEFAVLVDLTKGSEHAVLWSDAMSLGRGPEAA